MRTTPQVRIDLYGNNDPEIALDGTAHYNPGSGSWLGAVMVGPIEIAGNVALISRTLRRAAELLDEELARALEVAEVFNVPVSDPAESELPPCEAEQEVSA